MIFSDKMLRFPIGLNSSARVVLVTSIIAIAYFIKLNMEVYTVMMSYAHTTPLLNPTFKQHTINHLH